jgi:hypothetical protein
MGNNRNLNTKIHNLIRTNKSSVHDNCQKNKSKYDRASSVVAAPGAPSSSPLPPAFVQLSCGGWGYVRRSRGWRSLSVRNVVPTLTSDERQGLSLNGRC